MTVQECYESIGADFEGVLGRMGSEAMVKRFALKFLDEPSYRSLVKAVEEQNAEGAFRAAHTLKGICLNWDWTDFTKSAHPLRRDSGEESSTDMKKLTGKFSRSIRIP